ncbi:MAG: transposase, partial [Firmicutes bacterium]|nr:transposase [Bacillota bacterium]
SELALEGKLFVEFVALIYLSYIKGKMQEKGLFANYTIRKLLDELDVIECYESPDNALTVGEVLKKQEQLYNDLDVTPLMAKS